MTRIYKYALEREISMPAGAEILCVQTQHGTPYIWARVDPDAPSAERKFLIFFGTGYDITDDPGRYVGTYQLDGGALIVVYESEVITEDVVSSMDVDGFDFEGLDLEGKIESLNKRIVALEAWQKATIEIICGTKEKEGDGE